MITVTEISPAAKVSGLSSYLLKCDRQNVNFTNAIFSLGDKLAYYHQSIDAYEIPLPFLGKILDQLTYLDDIEVRLLKDEDKSIDPSTYELTEEEINAFRVKPFKHQIECINYGLNPGRKKWLNLMSMGLGKTLTFIYEAETLKRRGLIDHCLIVCGVDSLRQQWKREIEAFSTESVKVLGEKISRTGRVYYDTLKERAAQLKAPIDEFFVVTNIAALRSDDVMKAFKKSKNKFGLIGIDEIHRVGRKTSTSGAHVLKLQAEYQVGMSGSLVTNDAISCYMPLSWTGNDNAILTSFRAEYQVKGDYGETIGFRHMAHLKEELDACSFRRKLEDVKDDMPAKTISAEVLEMDEKQAKFYEAIKAGVKEEANRVELKANNLLALTTRLRQASTLPSILTTEAVSSIKIDRCVELVEDLIEAGEKVVVMDVFKDSVYTLEKLLAKYHPLIGTGDLPDSVVNSNIQKFRDDPDAKLLIGTSQKIGTGYSIPEAHYMIMLSTPWTWAEFSQNTDRIHRINSTCPVYIKVLIAKGTIDERAWDIIHSKKLMSDYLIDKIEADDSIVDKLGAYISLVSSFGDELARIIRGM